MLLFIVSTVKFIDIVVNISRCKKNKMAAMLLLLLCATLSATATADNVKHVMMVVIDDLGYDDLGFRNDDQILTPNFNKLANEGVVLERYYVQPSCSPTRATLMSGRKPVHTGINYWIPNIAIGLKLNESTLADVLNSRGFISHAVGKWHLGFFKTAYTPTFRGFSSFYGYYEGSEDYFTHETSGGLDFHFENQSKCGPGCTQLLWEAQGTYSTNLFSKRACDIIEAHPAATPLFMYLAYQGVHAPRQAPQSYVQPYVNKIADKGRQTFAGMIAALDEGLGNVTTAMSAKQMLDEVMIIVTTDNGGPTTECSTTGQSNWPLRGSKCSIWEGGTRGTSFVWTASMPMKGLKYYGLMHACDWMPTIISAIGAPPLKPGETLPLDGIDMWDALTTNASSPRKVIYYGISQQNFGPAVRNPEGFKIIPGGSGGGKGEWSPQQLPNASWSYYGASPEIMMPIREAQWQEGDDLLMFQVETDPGEHSPLDPSQNAAIVSSLQAIIAQYNKTKVPQQQNDPSCPKFAPINSPKGTWIGPWCN
eukprot:m.88955 g.88955  ORF g.88955 m.88955 type:complete len:535 (-) comp13198_c0_seq2:42-1646(-)